MSAATVIDFYKTVEQAEVSAWLDLIAAAPADFRAANDLKIREIAGVRVLTCPKIPFRLFNRALDLGIPYMAAEQTLDAVLAAFAEAGVADFYLHTSPAADPENLPERLRARGLENLSNWTRVVRVMQWLEYRFPPAHYRVVEVGDQNAEAWAAFVDRCYGLNTSPWLLKLVGRKGWRHFMALDGDHIEAARSMRINPDGSAYWCIDAPVPGIMTKNLMPDFYLCGHMIRVGLDFGARFFVADIEKSDPQTNGEAYLNFERLGFKVLYQRVNWGFRG